MTTNFRNTKFQLNSDTRLSESSWEEGAGFYGSIAIFRKDSGKWSLDQNTVISIRKDDKKSCDYAIADFATDLAHDETGEWLRLHQFVV